jgi:riboflavin synthase
LFTGIVEEMGTIRSVRKGASSSVLTIGGEVIFSDLKLGDSVAVNGVCLTVTSYGSDWFTADVMHETLSRSSLRDARTGMKVNLERAMASDGRFGGHIVSGHIDGTGTITSTQRDDNAIWYTVEAPASVMRYIVEKGSVTIDGISLTVARVAKTSFMVSVIPHTAAVTVLGGKGAGDIVNLENDIIGKYVEKLLQPAETEQKSGITRDFLTQYGF